MSDWFRHMEPGMKAWEVGGQQEVAIARQRVTGKSEETGMQMKRGVNANLKVDFECELNARVQISCLLRDRDYGVVPIQEVRAMVDMELQQSRPTRRTYRPPECRVMRRTRTMNRNRNPPSPPRTTLQYSSTRPENHCACGSELANPEILVGKP